MDTTIRRIERAYEDLGRLEEITSYDAATAGTAKNEVKHTFGPWGTVTKSEQEHDGQVDGSTLAVDYDYADSVTSSVAKYVRLNYLEYPNARKVYSIYTGGDAHASVPDNLSRVAAISTASTRGEGDANVIAAYEYNGTGWMVQKNLPEPNVKLDYTDATDDPYDVGFDRFGRIAKHLWYDTGSSSNVFDIRHGYDGASNRTHAERKQYLGYSHYYTYDNLHRLKNFATGKPTYSGGTMNGVAAQYTWRRREREWTLDALGNQTSIKDFGRSAWYTNEHNAANEFDDDSGDRKVIANYGVVAMFSDGFASDTSSNYTKPGSGDAFDVNSTTSSYLTFTTVAQDSIGGNQEDEARALVVTGELIGTHQLLTTLKFPGGTESGYAGLVFGYKSAQDYWMYVLNIGTQKEELYHVVDGSKGSTLKESAKSIAADTLLYLSTVAKRNCIQSLSHNFTNGFPSGTVGVVTNVTNAKFDRLDAQDYSVAGDLAGRWSNPTRSTTVINDANGDQLYPTASWDTCYVGKYLHNVRLDKFKADFCVRKCASGTRTMLFSFNGQDADDFFELYVYHTSTQTAPLLRRFSDGDCYTTLTTTPTSSNMPTPGDNDPLWVRVVVNPDDGGNEHVKVYCATTSGGLDTAETQGDEVLTYDDSAGDLDGGFIGFDASTYAYVDNLTIKAWDGDSWETETWEGFEMTSGKAEEAFAHDAAGNLTYDGMRKFKYDAWNRLTQVNRAYRNSGGTLQTTSAVATITYDGLGRRIKKAVTNSGDWDATYHYYYDGQRMVETRNGSDWVLKQYVWGQTYVDELVQIAVNGDPDVDSDCLDGDSDASYYALQDANFNVLGLIESDGDLKERYEYTPYGQRTVYKSAGSDDPLCMAPLMESQRVEISSVAQPYGLCDVGHQGLLHDKEFGLIHNRARSLHPPLGRFLQRDPLGYVDGMSLYEYVRSTPIFAIDPLGLRKVSVIAFDARAGDIIVDWYDRPTLSLGMPVSAMVGMDDFSNDPDKLFAAIKGYDPAFTDPRDPLAPSPQPSPTRPKTSKPSKKQTIYANIEGTGNPEKHIWVPQESNWHPRRSDFYWHYKKSPGSQTLPVGEAALTMEITCVCIRPKEEAKAAPGTKASAKATPTTKASAIATYEFWARMYVWRESWRPEYYLWYPTPQSGQVGTDWLGGTQNNRPRIRGWQRRPIGMSKTRTIYRYYAKRPLVSVGPVPGRECPPGTVAQVDEALRKFRAQMMSLTEARAALHNFVQKKKWEQWRWKRKR